VAVASPIVSPEAVAFDGRAEQGRVVVVRRALIGTIVATFGIVSTLGVGYSAEAKPGTSHRGQKLANALRKCEKDKSKSKRERCQKTAKAKYKSMAETGGHKRTGAATPPVTGATGPTGPTGTMPARPEEALSAMLIVHVYAEGGEPVSGGPEACMEKIHRPGAEGGFEEECRGNTLWVRHAEEATPLRITRVENPPRLGADGEILKDAVVTPAHTIRVAPGRYEIGLGVQTKYTPATVTVNAGETLEARIVIDLM
jgi:hypothetical protein